MLKFLAMFPGDYEWGFFEALLVSLVAIAFVFLILFVIILCVGAMQKLFFGNKKEEKAQEVVNAPVAKPTASVAKKEVKNTEIKDEDMMVAALIATIDYANETKKDVRLVSIKQIG